MGPAISDIDDRTKVSLFAVLTTVPVIAATIFFVAMIYFKAEAAEARLDRQGDALKDQRAMLIEIRERTARIETLLDQISKNHK